MLLVPRTGRVSTRLLTRNASSSIEILGKHYRIDTVTNVPNSIIAKTPLKLHTKPSHPLSTLRSLVESHWPTFAHLNSLSPLVTPFQNFDSLSFRQDHPGRAPTDSYYVNRDLMLRTHTSAHEVDVFSEGNSQWLLTADVYRRDEIDSSHYPVFHQMEGARTFNATPSDMHALKEENAHRNAELARAHIEWTDVAHFSPANPIQPVHNPEYAVLVAENLKLQLNGLILKLFGGIAGVSKENPLQVRWIEAYFPFTSPSFEVEVLFRGKWLEILGCGVSNQEVLNRGNMKDKIGWAFGLGMERIAMVLFGIPDIRLFWSEDPRFITQFEQGRINMFKPYSKYPSTWRDVSFWTGDKPIHDNDFCDIVRDVAGDLVEDVKLIDNFTHPKTQRNSLSWRIHYRSMDKSLASEEVNALHALVNSGLRDRFGVEIR